ncbi:MAG: hypothetical protein EOP09_18880, partial [Proteobacteria bacterium]
ALEARANGDFKSVLDFVKRVPTRKVNKKVLESLTTSGAFDTIGEVNRPSLLASMENLIQVASDEQEERELGQTSLFDNFSAEEIKLVTPMDAIFKQEPDWPRSKRLVAEKAITGFYVSGHPMDPWQRIAEDWLGWSIEKLKTWGGERAEKLAEERRKAPPNPYNGREPRVAKPEVRIAGLITESKEIMTKKGSRMAFAKIEDLSSSIELVFFPEAYTASQTILMRSGGEAEPILVTGELECSLEKVQIMVKSLEWLEETHKNRVSQVIFKIPVDQVTPEQLRGLKRMLIESRGKTPVRMMFEADDFRTQMELPKTVGVEASPQFVEQVDKLFGFKVVQLQ